MKCPHCQVTVHSDFSVTNVVDYNRQLFTAKNTQGAEVSWYVNAMVCPACRKGILSLGERLTGASYSDLNRLIQPNRTSRPVAPPEVPTELAEDFNEAAAVIEDSPKASAALSRRCLQGILRLNGYNQRDLAPAIDAILNARVLPSTLAESVDSIRAIGNFAAHPAKDSNTNAIVSVEPHEADWNLDVLEGLFDFFYVAPRKEQKKRDTLNEKLAAAKKPPIK